MSVRLQAWRRGFVAVVALAVAVAGLVVGASPVRAEVDPGLPAPTGVTAAAVVSGLRVSWSPPADDATVTGYHVTTPEGVDRLVGPEVDELVVDVASPGDTVTVSVAAVHGADESSPVSASGAALSPGGLQRVLKTPAKLSEATVGTTATTVRIAGRGSVPLTGVRSVVLLARVGSATRSTTVQVGSGTSRTSIAVALGDTRVRVVTLPVGAAGVPVRTTTGRARVRLDVLGWTSTSSAAAVAEAGRIGIGTPAAVLAPTALAKGATRSVAVLGKGDVPGTGVAAVVVAIRAAATSSRASVAIGPSGTTPAVPVASAPARGTEAVTLPVAVGPDGRIRIRNLGASTTTVAAQVVGWIGDGTAGGADGVGEWTNDVAPMTMLSARRPAGTVQVGIAGRATVPSVVSASPPRAVLVRATLSGTSAAARPSLTLGATGASRGLPAAVATGTRAVTTTSWVDLGDAGTITAAVGGATANVRLEVLAWTVGRPTLTAAAVVLTAAESSRYDGIEDGAGTVTDPATIPAVGKVLVTGPSAAHPDGFLRRITGVQDQGGGVWAVTTAPADLVDVVRSASVSRTTPLSSPVVTDPGDPGVSRERASRRAGVGWTVTRSFEHQVAAGGGVLGLSGSAQLGASNNLALDLGWRGVKAEVSTTVSEALHVQLSASAELSASASLALGTIRFARFVVQVGPVPVVITPTATLHLDAGAAVGASYSASLDQSASGTVGVRYDGGPEAIKQFDDQPPTLTAGGTPPHVSASASLGVDVALQFYGGVASAGIGLSVGATSDYASGSCFVENDAHLDASLFASVDLPVVDDLGISESFRLKEWDLPDVRVPGDHGCPWTGIVEIDSSWQGEGTVHDPLGNLVFSRSGHTTARLRRVSPEDSRDGHWEGTATNGFNQTSAYSDCGHTLTGVLSLDDDPPESSVDRMDYQPGIGWSLGFTMLDAGTTAVDDGPCGTSSFEHFRWDDDLGLSMMLAHVSDVMVPNDATTLDRTYVFDVDSAPCGSLPVEPAGAHWCHGVQDPDDATQSGQVRIRIRMTTLEDLDADGIPDADQNP